MEIASVSIDARLDFTQLDRDYRRLEKDGEVLGKRFASAFSSGMRGAGITDSLTKSIGAERLGSDTASKFTRSFGSSIQSQSANISALMVGAFAGAGIAIAGVISSAISSGVSAGMSALSKSIATASEFQRLSKTLEFVAGSSRAAAQEQAYLNDTIAKFALPAAQATEEFIALAAAAKGTSLEGQGIRDVFTAAAQASRVFGLSAEQTKGVLNALQQMISKGKVSAEELRGQLGERLPGAFQIAARAAGVTTSQLDEMLQKGLVLSEEFLPLFAAQLEKETRGGVAGAMNTVAAASETLSNKLVALQRDFGNAIQPAVQSSLSFVSEILGGINIDFGRLNGLAQDFSRYLSANPQIAREMSDAIQQFIEDGLEVAVGAAKKLGDFLKDNPGTIQKMTTELAEFGKGLSDIVGLANTLTGALTGAGKELDKIGQAIQKLNLPGVTAESGTSLFGLGIVGKAIDQATGGFFTGRTTGTDQTPLYQAIVAQESGGRPGEVQERTGALGLGQVMPSNVPSWTQEALGRSMTPEQFLKDTDAQMKTINFKLNQMLEKNLKLANGNMELAVKMVAAEWHSGNPNNWNHPTITDGYIRTQDYANSIWSRYQGAQKSQPPVDQGKGYTITTPRPIVNPGLNLAAAGTQRNQHFGAPRDGGKREHKGVDEALPFGTPIKAPWDGVVKTVTTSKGEIWLVLETTDTEGRKHQVKLGHLSASGVKPGDKVTAGQIIAKSGSHHLHTEVKIDKVQQDPKKYLGGTIATATTSQSVQNDAKTVQREREKAEREAQRAIDEAKRLRTEADRKHAERVDADRRIRDQELEQQTEKGRIGLSGVALERYNQQRTGAATLQRLFDQRADVETARSIKLREGVKGGTDFSAVINSLTKQIEVQQQINTEKDKEIDKNDILKRQDTERARISEQRTALLGIQSQRGAIGLSGFALDRFNESAGYQATMGGYQDTIAELTAKRQQKLDSGADDGIDWSAKIQDVQALMAAETDLHNARLANIDELQRQQNREWAAERLQLNKSLLERLKTSREEQIAIFHKYVEESQTLFDKAHELQRGLIDGVGDSFKSAISEAIMGTKSLGEVALNMLGNIAQKLASLALDNIFGSAGGGGILGGLFNGLFGGNPAKGLQVGLNNPVIPIPRLPSYDIGTRRVPQDQIAVVHKNEAIIPADMNPFMGKGGMGGGVSITINQHNSPGDPAMTAKQARTMAEMTRRTVEAEINRQLRPGGSLGHGY